MAKWPYNTRRWRQLRLEKLRDQPLCEYCPPYMLTPATEVDHRQAINNGGNPWAWENLASTCGTCHKSKTVADKHGKPWRRKGFDENGMPLDDGHAWKGASNRHPESYPNQQDSVLQRAEKEYQEPLDSALGLH